MKYTDLVKGRVYLHECHNENYENFKWIVLHTKSEVNDNDGYISVYGDFYLDITEYVTKSNIETDYYNGLENLTFRECTPEELETFNKALVAGGYDSIIYKKYISYEIY